MKTKLPVVAGVVLKALQDKDEDFLTSLRVSTLVGAISELERLGMVSVEKIGEPLGTWNITVLQKEGNEE